MIQGIFHFEMMRAGRRRRGFYLRWIYAAFLLVQILPLFFLSNRAWTRLMSGFSTHAFFESFLTQHFVFLTLLTPAVVGGAITEEKARGTLLYLLTAPVHAGALIFGKIMAHVVQLLILSLVGLPLFCFFAALADDITFPLSVLLCSAGLVFGIAAMGTLLSAWCRTTRDAILSMYMLIGLAVLAVPYLAATSFAPWLLMLNPLHILSLEDAALRYAHLGPYLLGWLLLGLGCLLVASCGLRWVYRRQLQIVQPSRARWWRGKPGRVRGNPVLWREQKVEGIAPLAWLRRWPRWLGMVVIMIASVGMLAYMLAISLPPSNNAWTMIRAGEWEQLDAVLRFVAADAFFWHGLGVLVVVTLVVAVRASGAITGEKERGTWLALLLTPMTTQRIITGKHWGIFWACLPYVAAHAAVAIPLSSWLGFEPLTWAVLWTGVMLLGIILGSAVGLWSSARATSSWRSLLTTLAVFYLGWLLFLLPVTCLLFVVKGVLDFALLFIGLFADTRVATGVINSVNLFSWAVCFGLAAAFWFLTHRLLAAAVQRVGRNDRTAELEFDYYFLYRDYYRRKQEEQWDSPRLDDLYEVEASVPKPGREQHAPIPFQS